MSADAILRVPLDHPSLAGHFPGRPIVPGVLLLEFAAASAPLHGTLRRVIAAKFLQPAWPDAELRFAFEVRSPTRCRFAVRTGETRVAEGELEFTPPP